MWRANERASNAPARGDDNFQTTATAPLSAVTVTRILVCMLQTVDDSTRLARLDSTRFQRNPVSTIAVDILGDVKSVSVGRAGLF